MMIECTANCYRLVGVLAQAVLAGGRQCVLQSASDTITREREDVICKCVCGFENKFGLLFVSLQSGRDIRAKLKPDFFNDLGNMRWTFLPIVIRNQSYLSHPVR